MTIDVARGMLVPFKGGIAMDRTAVQRLARVLRVLVIVAFACNLIALLLVPGMAAIRWAEWAPEEILDNILHGAPFDTPEDYRPGSFWVGFMGLVFLESFWRVWTEGYPAVLTLFLWACGTCTAVILWQGKRVLDTILRGEPFTLDNAKNLKRAAVCCFVISGAALARLIWGFATYRSILPLLTYNALFVPVFLLAGLVCMVMSALFRQAAELKADNDLTI